MTQENKQLLLKDLCARSPYGVKGFVDGLGTVFLRGFADYIANDVAIEHDGNLIWMEVSNFKPYLRPMSSMTKNEKHELLKFGGVCYDHNDEVIGVGCTEFSNNAKVQDWLNAHHFDYRGLIEMGLALAAPKDIYKI